ncbi:type II secretion system protein N [Thiomonas intermedia]|uniref:type II secretion system protein N n=1 Tax=Thiomonas intermedia TaxID=926 RepID=UPI001FE738B7|nr:type II secretion system protein N [Thiomonas intermedia]
MNSASAHRSRQVALMLGVLLAFACAALAVTWVLRLVASPQTVPAGAQLIGALSPEQAARQAARLFGAEPVGAASAAPSAPSRFRLYGVIAGGDSGSALIGVDGKPPRAVRVGDPVAPGIVLHATGYKIVWLDYNGTRQELKMDPQHAFSSNRGFNPPSFAQRPQPFPQPPLAAPGIAPAQVTPATTDNER